MDKNKKLFYTIIGAVSALAAAVAALLALKKHKCAEQKLNAPTPSIHRLRRGLPGYLILFAPHAFVSQRQWSSSKSPSPLVFLPISTHFTATPGIPFTSPTLKNGSFKCRSWVEPMSFTSDLSSRLHTLYTQ